jgi:ABC-type transporter lipoprotein component MlaA
MSGYQKDKKQRACCGRRTREEDSDSLANFGGLQFTYIVSPFLGRKTVRGQGLVISGTVSCPAISVLQQFG